MSATHIADLFDDGILALVKVPRSTVKRKNGSPKVSVKPVALNFILKDNTRETMHLPIIDGAICYVGIADGREYPRPLDLVRPHPRFGGRGSLWMEYRIPLHPLVPTEHQGARTFMKIKQRDPANCELFKDYRFYPESSPQFQELHGRRQDIESGHETYESTLPERRSRSWTRLGAHADLRRWAIYINLQARGAYDYRTGDPPLKQAA